MPESTRKEPVDLKLTQVLAEVQADGEIRMLLDDDPAFGTTDKATARIVSLAETEAADVIEPTARPDSRATMLVPSFDVDEKALFRVEAEVHRGPQPLVVLSSESPVPRGVVVAVIRRVAEALSEKAEDGKFENAVDVSREFYDSVATRVLRTRIWQVEESVRQALADEEVTSQDYSALRDYPRQLATVEALCSEVRNAEPTWESLRPKPRPSVYGIAPVVPEMDFFWKWVKDVETEAKEAVSRLSGLIASQQVVIVQRQRLEVERFQRVVTVVGAAVLVPGLVAGIFGANVDFPGRNTGRGFAAMLLLMTAGGVGSYAVLRSIELGAWRPVTVRWSQWSERRRLIAVMVTTIAFAAAGLYLLLG